MPVQSNIGKVAAAIEAGKRAAASIDIGPVQTLDVVQWNQTKFISDWQNDPMDSSIFVWGVDTWALPSLKVTK